MLKEVPWVHTFGVSWRVRVYRDGKLQMTASGYRSEEVARRMATTLEQQEGTTTKVESVPWMLHTCPTCGQERS